LVQNLTPSHPIPIQLLIRNKILSFLLKDLTFLWPHLHFTSREQHSSSFDWLICFTWNLSTQKDTPVFSNNTTNTISGLSSVTFQTSNIWLIYHPSKDSLVKNGLLLTLWKMAKSMILWSDLSRMEKLIFYPMIRDKSKIYYRSWMQKSNRFSSWSRLLIRKRSKFSNRRKIKKYFLNIFPPFIWKFFPKMLIIVLFKKIIQRRIAESYQFSVVFSDHHLEYWLWRRS